MSVYVYVTYVWGGKACWLPWLTVPHWSPRKRSGSWFNRCWMVLGHSATLPTLATGFILTWTQNMWGPSWMPCTDTHGYFGRIKYSLATCCFRVIVVRE